MNRVQRLTRYVMSLNAVAYFVYAFLDYYYRIAYWGGVPSVQYLVQVVVIGVVVTILVIEYSRYAEADNILEAKLDSLQKRSEEIRKQVGED
jgi:hypothetical protein